jgi:molybdopterin-guanine dinucleotide biosynthesis protein A
MAQTATLILAGGAARRLGGVDKPLIVLNNRSLLERILATLQPAGGSVALSVNRDPSRYAQFHLPVLNDGAFAGQGPLAGVLAGLDWAHATGATQLLSIPGDTPFIPRGLATKLEPAPSCAATSGRAHHLVALWPVTARPILRDFLSKPGSRRARDFAALIGMRQVDFPVLAFDPFCNLNTPDDRARAQALAERLDAAGDGP